MCLPSLADLKAGSSAARTACRSVATYLPSVLFQGLSSALLEAAEDREQPRIASSHTRRDETHRCPSLHNYTSRS